MVISVTQETSVIPIIASIQPIDEVQGLVYYKNTVAQTSRGNVNKGDTLVSATEGRKLVENGYASEEIFNEFTGQTGDGSTTQFAFSAKYTPVRVRSVTITVQNETAVKGIDDGEGNIFGLGIKSGTIDYENGSVTIEFSEAPANGDEIYISYATDFEMIDELPTINTTFESKVIKARTFALRGINTLFKNYQLEKRFGIDASDMVARELIQELNTETSNAVVAEAYMNALGQVEWDRTSPDGVSYTEHKLTFFDAISNAEATILKNAGKFLGGSVIIAGSDVAAIIRTLPGFKSADVENAVLGTHFFGTLDGKPVIRSLTLPSNEALLLAKGASFYDTPVIYAPYMPLFVSDSYASVDHNPLKSQRVVATQAGISAPVRTLITKIVVTAS
jgi:hypothetical protein